MDRKSGLKGHALLRILSGFHFLTATTFHKRIFPQVDMAPRRHLPIIQAEFFCLGYSKTRAIQKVRPCRWHAPKAWLIFFYLFNKNYPLFTRAKKGESVLMQIVLSDIFSSSMNQIVPEPKISASNYNLLWQPAKSMTRQGWSSLKITKRWKSNKLTSHHILRLFRN